MLLLTQWASLRVRGWKGMVGGVKTPPYVDSGFYIKKRDMLQNTSLTIYFFLPLGSSVYM